LGGDRERTNSITKAKSLYNVIYLAGQQHLQRGAVNFHPESQTGLEGRPPPPSLHQHHQQLYHNLHQSSGNSRNMAIDPGELSGLGGGNISTNIRPMAAVCVITIALHWRLVLRYTVWTINNLNNQNTRLKPRSPSGIS
jgi:hypothetical protein